MAVEVLEDVLSEIDRQSAEAVEDIVGRNHARRYAVGRPLVYGVIPISPYAVEAFPSPKHPYGKLFATPWLEADGWILPPANPSPDDPEPYGWTGVPEFPETPIRPSLADAPGRFDPPRNAAGGASGGGGGGGGASGDPEALLRAERVRAQWRKFMEHARNKKLWKKRQEHRAWLLGGMLAGWAACNLGDLRQVMEPQFVPLFDPRYMAYDSWPDCVIQEVAAALAEPVPVRPA